jgi:prophage regulatory protein
MKKLKLIKRTEVEAITSLKRSSIYAKMSEGTFPKPIKLGSRSVAWIEAEVQEWVENRIQESRKEVA